MSWALSSKVWAWGRSWAALPPENLNLKLELISSGTTKIELQAQRSSQLAYALHYFTLKSIFRYLINYTLISNKNINKIKIFNERKKNDHFGPKCVTSRDPYQSIDLTEYYKSYNRHKELGRGRQALEGAKVSIFSIFYNF